MTAFPGTTEKITEYLASKGKKTKVSFCLERIAQGKAIEELKASHVGLYWRFDRPDEQEKLDRLFGSGKYTVVYKDKSAFVMRLKD